MKIFAVPYHPNHINPVFIQAFSNLSRILKRLNVELIIIDCRFDGDAHLEQKIKAILSWVDGLIFIDNPYNLNPEIYSQPAGSRKNIDPYPESFHFTKSMIDQAQEMKIPILGLGEGAWHLNVAKGGSLQLHPTQKGRNKQSLDGRVSHPITVRPNTVLHSIFKSDEVRVNSPRYSYNSIEKLGRDLRMSASAAGGVIEAIEADDDSFCLGVQFHPEYLICGDVEDGFVSRSEIRTHYQLFKKMAEAAESLQETRPLNRLEEQQKERTLIFHQKNTDALTNTSAGYGYFKLG